MKAWIAYLLQGTFWYVILDAEGKEHVITIQHSGGSMNGRPEYAAKGAITSATAGAVSKLGFQKSVYLGLRSHKTVGKQPGNGKGATTVATKTCPVHKVPQRQYDEKGDDGKPNGTKFFAHQLADKSWCSDGKSRPPKPKAVEPIATPARAPAAAAAVSPKASPVPSKVAVSPAKPTAPVAAN